VLLTGAACAVLATSLTLLRPSEPVYQGKPVTYWFERLTLPGVEPAQPALREIGPKAVPFLLREVDDQNALSRRIHRAIWWSTPGVLRRILPKPIPVDSSL
jgi:hypothetical protein